MELVVEVVEGIDFAEVGGFVIEEFGLVGAATFGCALGPASIYFRFQKKYKSRGMKNKRQGGGGKKKKKVERILSSEEDADLFSGADSDRGIEVELEGGGVEVAAGVRIGHRSGCGGGGGRGLGVGAEVVGEVIRLLRLYCISRGKLAPRRYKRPLIQVDNCGHAFWWVRREEKGEGEGEGKRVGDVALAKICMLKGIILVSQEGPVGNEGVLSGGRGRGEGVRGDVIDRCGSPEGIVKGCEAVCGVGEADSC